MATRTNRCTIKITDEFLFEQVRGDWNEAESGGEYTNIVNQCNALGGNLERGYVGGESNRSLAPGGNPQRPNESSQEGESDCCTNAPQYNLDYLTSQEMVDRRLTSSSTTDPVDTGETTNITYHFTCSYQENVDGMRIWRRQNMPINADAPIQQYQRIENWEEDWELVFDCPEDPDPDSCCNGSSSSSSGSSSTTQSLGINITKSYLGLGVDFEKLLNNN